jgi:hypothetical protein
MVSDAIENCIMNFENFDPAYGENPFAYFSQIAYFAFLRKISTEERSRYAIYKNFQETITGHDYHLLVDSDDNHVVSTKLYDNINVFMDKFERKEEIKKQKRKQNKEGLVKFVDE